MLLAIAPDVFHWVKFRRIRRQELQFNRPTLRGDKLSHQPTAMNGQTVPNESQSTADVTLQMFQKLDDLRRLDATGKKPKVKIPEGNARDGTPFGTGYFSDEKHQFCNLEFSDTQNLHRI